MSNTEIKKQLEEKIYEMEKVAKVFDIEPFDVYFLGGSGCILGGYNDRATRDFDFIDLNYPSKLGKVFVHLREFDMLEYESTLISPLYKDRAKKLNKFKFLNIYVLSIEDIIVSKIIRLAKKDIQDIDKLIKTADKKLIKKIVDEVISREDLFNIKKKEFKRKLKIFKEIYHV
ncbi:MAG: hypothetical protein FH751_07295 [Firmicutes bacterium]|nr:hypothetical protein [Bacillota bacterium]